MLMIRKMEHIKDKEKKSFLFFLLLLFFLARVCSSSPSPPKPSGKKHFVLIHGAGHGAWSWYKVATLLKHSGHNVTALDLGASGINPIQVEQLHSMSQYVEPLTKLMVSLPPKERVILVAHSITGAVISIFMERFPEKIVAGVYATAFMSGLSLSYSTIFAEINKRLDYMDTQYRYDNGPKNPATSFRFGPKVMASNFYQLSPPELTKENYGSVPRVFIVAEQDHAIVLDVQNFMIKNNPPDEVKVIKGSDHMVMLSRPVELFSDLQDIAEKYS
ncbi:salicylic acid-binding protein 2-like [Prunus yedoensis var. nudiflora]|uniref:Salicylic acid-binding protein 2-like n=1 Tax=Prunus yedoensis var. nudiflora TaxID=2094558 RepID=A0A314UAK8_PRUYE|nr:salicylic acid-binding protein 2-like [Prunus yedoensis var. nudiflora]